MGAEQQSPANFAYAYCHGFLSGPASVKGQALRKTMLEAGVDMSLLNLNGEDSNDLGAITISGALKAVRQFHLDRKSTLGDPGLKLRLVGSSLGGYIVARCGNCLKVSVTYGRRCSRKARDTYLFYSKKQIYWPRLGSLYGTGCALHQLQYIGSRISRFPRKNRPRFLKSSFSLRACCTVPVCHDIHDRWRTRRIGSDVTMAIPQSVTWCLFLPFL